MSPGYLARRFLTILVTLLIVSMVVFGITQVLPGNAATMLLGENATPEQLAAVTSRLGLDRPVWLQYWSWFSGLLQGDFGTSLRTGLPVGPVMAEALGRSLLLALLAIVLMLVIAIPLGVLAALRRGGATDLGVSIGTYLGVSLPEFVTATLVLIFLAHPSFGLFPATGYVPLTEDFWSGLHHLALPVLTVSVVLVAHVSRMVRSELVDVLHLDYVRAAHLKGLSRGRILIRHALRNALLPTITIVALDVGYLLGGIIVVEEIFAFPGIGRELIVAIQARDLPSIQAGALIMAATYAIANLAADLCYAALDKRIQYA
ncbi:ABC transporter permease [Chelativorans sp. AA-79]|uniref:ABC transporter permease n=1 Tax=Chelativorans sp. AA-79 TaxID=3028735 RepID=UPI0023F75645|nr:ABC transporter permease [Chelativorans sp. AA-79]WEX09677.1 ABC transporter permease [Chelativorans sp. AA-79]